MRIVIFSDSLARARPDIDSTEKTHYRDTYGYKLEKYFWCRHQVDNLYVESLDTQDAIFWSQRMVAFREPDIVIFHLGINDCAPRIFKKNSRSIILKPWFRRITHDIFLKALSRARPVITKIRPVVYTDIDQFSNNITKIKNEILKYNPECKFIGISIAKSDFLDQKSYNYNRNVDSYNEVLKEQFENYIEINEIISEGGLISDHIHLTKRSHALLYEKLREKIEEMS